MNQEQRDDRVALVSTVLAAVILGGCISVAVSLDEKEYAGKAITILSPDYFECPPCRNAEVYLEHTYPGLNVSIVKLSREQVKGMCIQGFPTILVGERLMVGLDRDVVREEMNR